MDPRVRGKPSEEELAYVAEHLPELRGRVLGDEIRYSFLILWLLVGLAANVVGFLWSTGAADDLSALIADLLRSLGTALWTGVVVVALIQFLPDYLKRMAVRQLDAYADAIESRKGTGKG
jgi:hypothetical protein